MITPRVRVVAARKRRCIDDYEKGQDPDSNETETDLFFRESELHASLTEAFRRITGIKDIDPQTIGTIDNRIYQDVKDGPPRVVDDRPGRGIFRAHFDRTETRGGHAPSAETIEKWKAGEATLYDGYYELEFMLVFAGIEEKELAALCGVNNWS